MRAYAAMAQPYHGAPLARHMSPQPPSIGLHHVPANLSIAPAVAA